MEHLETKITLKPDVRVVLDSTGWAMRGGSGIRYAKDENQGIVIAQIAAGVVDIDAIKEAVHRAGSGHLRNDEVSLVVTGFILDFGEFLANHTLER